MRNVRRRAPARTGPCNPPGEASIRRRRMVIPLLMALVPVTLSGCGTVRTPALPPPHVSRTLPALFQPVVQDARRAGIPVVLPTRLPSPGLPGWTWSLVDYHLGSQGYRFALVMTRGLLPPNGYAGSPPGAGFALAMATVSGPAKPYPTELQLLAQPTGTVRVAPGITARSYNRGMMVRWTDRGWTYTAVGPSQGSGLGMARQIAAALGGNPQGVPGSRGQLTVSQLGNPMYANVYWTYGRRWFSMTGLGTPGERIRELRSLVRVGTSRSSG